MIIIMPAHRNGSARNTICVRLRSCNIMRGISSGWPYELDQPPLPGAVENGY